MVVVLDNYDSFTFNLVHYLAELGCEVEVVRNDALSATDLLAKRPSHVVISPGPCTPDQAGISLELIPAAAAAGVPGPGEITMWLGRRASSSSTVSASLRSTSTS